MYIWCDNCDARGPEKRESDDAIAAWNTRAAYEVMTRSDGEVERLRNALGEVCSAYSKGKSSFACFDIALA